MKLISATAFCTFLFLASACAHEPAITELPATSIPADEIAKMDGEINQARNEQIDVFAPTNFAKAESALSEAKGDSKGHDDAKDILRNVAVSRAYLAKATEFSKIAKDSMKEVVEARRLALKEGAKDTFAPEFKDADRDLKDVTAEVEDNKTGDVGERRTAILAKYLDLELKSIRRTALNTAEGKVNKAKKDNAEDWAPQSLALAEKSIKDADNFIISDRHETAKIKVLSDKAMADADKLILINKEARLGTKATGEQAALKLYSEREKVAQQQHQLANAQTEVNKLTAAKTDSANALANDQAYNQKFERAQKLFSKDEAEVYRQGPNLLIRLKGLEFTNATSTLKGSNFALLAKVREVIGDLNADTVTIEGHTDSVGSAAKNDKLSQERAEAVKSYFESNKSQGSSAQYAAMGYGFQKPIATNKTASGRAQNRRVDVQIHTAGANPDQVAR